MASSQGMFNDGEDQLFAGLEIPDVGKEEAPVIAPNKENRKSLEEINHSMKQVLQKGDGEYTSVFSGFKIENQSSKSKKKVSKPKPVSVYPYMKKKAETTTPLMSYNDQIFNKEAAAPGTKDVIIKFFVYREHAAKDYIELMNSKIKHLKLPVMFCGEFGEKITHYIPSIHPNVGLIKTANFYIAIGRNLWIVSKFWADAILSILRIPSEELYTMMHAWPVGAPHSYKVDSDRKFFTSFRFVFAKELPINFFKFSETDLARILAYAGGVILQLEFNQIKAYIKSSKPFWGLTYILAVDIGNRQNEINEIFKQYKWKTVHPQYFLDCLWELKLKEMTRKYLFITDPTNTNIKKSTKQ